MKHPIQNKTRAALLAAACCCSSLATLAQVPAIIQNPVNRVTCHGTPVTFTASAANANTYQWEFSTDATDWFSVPGNGNGYVTGGNTTTLTILGPNAIDLDGYFFRLKASSATLPVYSALATLKVYPRINIVGSQTNVTCNGASNGTASIIASAGTGTLTYNWSPGSPTGDGTKKVTGLTPGNWSVTVTDSKGCTAVQNFILTQPDPLTISGTQTNASIFGASDGTATAIAAGGTGPYSFSWNTPSLQNTPTATGLSAGTYTITITDAEGCTATKNFTITQPAYVAPPTITTLPLTVNQVKDGNKILVSYSKTGTFKSAYFTFQLSDSAGSFTNPVDLIASKYNPLGVTIPAHTVPANHYRIRVINIASNVIGTNNGSDLAIYNNPPTPVAQSTRSCSGDSVTLTASGAPTGGSYRWYNSKSSIVVLGTKATYTTPVLNKNTNFYVATANNLGIEGQKIRVIAFVSATPNFIAVAASGASAIMQGNSIKLAAKRISGSSSGLTYNWSPATGLNNPNIAKPIATPNSTTIYTLTVSKSNGCSSISSVTINVIPATAKLQNP